MTTSYIEVGQRLLLPLARLNIYHVRLCRHVKPLVRSTSQDDTACHIAHREILQVLLARERRQGGLEQLRFTSEVSILPRRHRAAEFEGK